MATLAFFGNIIQSVAISWICGEADHCFSSLFFSFQALGFVEADSAGQTNIFAVEPKQYVGGNVAASDSTVGAAAIAGTVAVGAFIAGLILVQGSSVDVGPTGDFLTLTEYKMQFSAEFKTPAAAPAVVAEEL